jgi:alkanesulfonate monooxygenase SsuD/methylene tetrahydromethanopterin reductase-like flavin-dependent oxidoreductase (luciferase family)
LSLGRQAHFTLLATLYGVHPASLRDTGSADPRDIGQWSALAWAAERGGIDAIFLADAPVAGGELSRAGSLEPLTLLSALARDTTGLGLIGTASTSFNEPYNVARQFASLHAISRGRAGWNSVGTSHPGAAENFGDTRWADHSRRYRIGHEFTEVVLRLWEAGDKPVNHVGEFFRVRGPLNIGTSAHDRPLITQAGGSPEGIRLAGRFADMTFAILPDLPAAKEYAARVRTAEQEAGRRAGSVLILPGIVPYLADTEEEAGAYKAGLDAALDLDPLYPIVGRYLHLEAAELRRLPLDEPFPVEILALPAEVDNSVATFTSLRAVIEQTKPTVRQVLIKASGGNRHREFVGTPESFAEEVEEWLGAAAADGFTLLLPETRRDLAYFADRVAPVLRRRGSLPDSYPSDRLRERLGVAPVVAERPLSQTT